MHPLFLAHLTQTVMKKKIKISSTFSVFSNNGHVGWMSGLPDTILKGGHQRTEQSLVPMAQ
jgi:hypothetical protein